MFSGWLDLSREADRGHKKAAVGLLSSRESRALLSVEDFDALELLFVLGEKLVVDRVILIGIMICDRLKNTGEGEVVARIHYGALLRWSRDANVNGFRGLNAFQGFECNAEVGLAGAVDVLIQPEENSVYEHASVGLGVKGTC